MNSIQDTLILTLPLCHFSDEMLLFTSINIGNLFRNTYNVVLPRSYILILLVVHSSLYSFWYTECPVCIFHGFVDAGELLYSMDLLMQGNSYISWIC